MPWVVCRSRGRRGVWQEGEEDGKGGEGVEQNWVLGLICVEGAK